MDILINEVSRGLRFWLNLKGGHRNDTEGNDKTHKNFVIHKSTNKKFSSYYFSLNQSQQILEDEFFWLSGQIRQLRTLYLAYLRKVILKYLKRRKLIWKMRGRKIACAKENFQFFQIFKRLAVMGKKYFYMFLF